MPPPPLETLLAQSWPPAAWQDVTVLLAVSGGADSVALLRAMVRLKTGGAGTLCAAHFNHRLRGAESAADEAFVVELCRQVGIPCEVGCAVADLEGEGGDGIEAAARTARYEFLEAAAARRGARYVVTAHTADDQAETILHRILRGTGLGGLAGIERARPLGHATLLRPMLSIRRSEVLAYLNEIAQPYRDDTTNADRRFTRNRVRHELLPHLAAAYNPGVVDALLRLGTLAGEAQTVIESIVVDLVDRCVTTDGPDAVTMDAARLAGQPAYVVRELLLSVWRRRGWPMQSMGFAQWDLLAQMLASSGSKHVLPGGIVAEARRDVLRLTPTPRERPPGALGENS